MKENVDVVSYGIYDMDYRAEFMSMGVINFYLVSITAQLCKQSSQQTTLGYPMLN